MNTRTRSGIIMVMVVGLTLALAPMVRGEQICWQLADFVDTLIVDYTADGAQYALTGEWLGLTVYRNDGAGTGSVKVTESGTIAILQMTFHNPDNFFFDGNHIGRFGAAVDLTTGEGPWYADFGGIVEPPFPVTGTLIPITCDTEDAALIAHVGGKARLSGDPTTW